MSVLCLPLLVYLLLFFLQISGASSFSPRFLTQNFSFIFYVNYFIYVDLYFLDLFASSSPFHFSGLSGRISLPLVEARMLLIRAFSLSLFLLDVKHPHPHHFDLLIAQAPSYIHFFLPAFRGFVTHI